MGPPTARFERMLIGGEMAHCGNPVMEWCVSNTIVLKDPAGLIKPDKNAAEKNKKRIDGVVSCIIATGCYEPDDASSKKSPYEGRKLRVL
jgi:phage terminase large subunit-like protein